jgi:3-phenylpropionate/trans-cinnamate dioxygenase ferredoxin reductase component
MGGLRRRRRVPYRAGKGPRPDGANSGMTRHRTFVIVGASLAGAKAAETLREEGFDGRIVLIGAEPDRPYERPPLSKEYLRGEAGRERVYVHDERYYAAHDIDLQLGRTAVSLDPGAKEIELDDGERVAYDRLLLTTGARPNSLPVAGSDLDGVLVLRSVEDSDVLRDRLSHAESLVVIGSGWIGAEVAASARQLGVDVTMVGHRAMPLERVLGPQVGAVYRDVHADHGVRMCMETGVEAFEGVGRVERVRTSDDRELPCDLVVVGVGVQPRSELAARAGLAVDDGILVDEHLRTTSPGVFAAGDVASARHPFYNRRVRVEHWSNALNQGPAAARSMLGGGEPYERLPYFFSDQYDVGMEYMGLAGPRGPVVFRGDPSAREFIAFWLSGDRIVAGMNVNVWDVVEPIQQLIRDRAPVDVDRLADPDVALEDVRVPAASTPTPSERPRA